MCSQWLYELAVRGDQGMRGPYWVRKERGSGDPLSHNHLGSKMGICLTCDYSVLRSHHRDDCLNILQDEDYA